MQVKKLFAVMMIALLTFMTMATGQVANAEAGDPGTGSLTIHKYELESEDLDSGEDGDGSEGQTVPGDAKLLNGVEFTITQTHSFDSETDRWAPISNGPTLKQITVDGKVVFDNLPLGRYLVDETAGPPHVNLNPNAYSVDIPMTSADGTTINYNVHIYPKNETIRGAVELLKKNGENDNVAQAGAKFTLHHAADDAEVNLGTVYESGSDGLIPVDGLAYGDYYFIEVQAPDGFMIQKGKHEFSITASGSFNVDGVGEGTIEKVVVINYLKPDIEKEVDQPNANRGDTVTYTLKIDLPGDIQDYKNFVITDELDSRLSYVAGSESGPAGFTFGANGQVLTWTANPAALEGVKQVVITFDALIAENAEGGTIENTGSIDYENQSGTTGYKETPATIITLTDGGFKVLKVDAKDNTITLAGAKFKLTDAAGVSIDATGTPITVNGVAHTGLLENLVTDANGEIKIDGLDVGTYYLVETKAPTYMDGNVEKSYRMLTQKIKVDVADGDSSSSKTVTVENSKSGWDLPKTGGIGTTLFTGVGLLLMGAAVFILARRKNSAIQ